MKEVYGNFDTVLEDMFDSIEYLHSKGEIDKDNVCVYGGSYGGYAATQGPMMRPDLFRCAVSEAGLYDINAQYTSGDIRWARGGKKFLEATFGDGEEAVIDLRSKSRVGQSDIGANADRIREFIRRF